MFTENLSTLKINKLTQNQYDRELAAGNIETNVLYLTPDDDNIFIATYGVTTSAEIENAYNEGKIVVAKQITDDPYKVTMTGSTPNSMAAPLYIGGVNQTSNGTLTNVAKGTTINGNCGKIIINGETIVGNSYSFDVISDVTIDRSIVANGNYVTTITIDGELQGKLSKKVSKNYHCFDFGDKTAKCINNVWSLSESSASAITGNVGDFVVIGSDGNLTTKTVYTFEGASF